MQIRGSNVLVTGASSGIGQALCLELARRGATRLALVGRRRDALDDTAAQVRALGAEPLVLVADVAQRAEIEKATLAAESWSGGLDLVVANAGVGTGGSRLAKPEDVEKVTGINYLGAVWTLLAGADPMSERRRGTLVAVSSVAGMKGLPRGTEYSASKAALDTFCEGLRVQLRPSNVKLLLVRPGYVQTPLSAKVKSKPFEISAHEAARRIADAIAADRRLLQFPWPLVWVMRAVSVLPDWLYERVAKKI